MLGLEEEMLDQAAMVMKQNMDKFVLDSIDKIMLQNNLVCCNSCGSSDNIQAFYDLKVMYHCHGCNSDCVLIAIEEYDRRKYKEFLNE